MADAYAKASCLDVCNMVLTKLPRELRDMVYEFIFDKSHIAVDHTISSPICNCMAGDESSLHGEDSKYVAMFPECKGVRIFDRAYLSAQMKVMSKLHPLHIMNKNYVGAAFLSELAGTCHKKKVFTIHNPASVATFVGGSEVDLIKAVDVVISDNIHYPVIYQGPNIYPTEAIVQAIGHLSNLNTTCRITIRMLVFPPDPVGAYDDPNESLRRIFRAVMQLRSSGHDIGVVPGAKDDGMEVFRKKEFRTRNDESDWILEVTGWIVDLNELDQVHEGVTEGG
jgi:hypothetical protein